MKCPQCGHDNTEDAQFCGGCGANLSRTHLGQFILGEASVGTELPMVGFGEAISRGFRNYATFSGRATRAEYWWWVLLTRPGLLVIVILDAFVPLLLTPLFFLGTLIPSLAVGVRRLHDINRTGWWLLLWPVPLLGIVLFVWATFQGDEGPNKYGPDPRRATSQ